MDPRAKIPIKGSKRAAGRHRCANKEAVIPALGRRLRETAISLGLPEGCYARIAPCSELTVRNRLTTGLGVIDAD